MQAIILAAGMGKRLKELTRSNTKCMIKVNGIPLIERLLHQLEKQHLSKIVIVVGYEGKKLIEYIKTLGIVTPIVYINNPIYYKTNNIYSLALAQNYLISEDTLLFESDLIIDDAVIDLLVEDPRETLALVDKYEAWMNGTCVKLSEDDAIEAFIPGNRIKFSESSEYYKTVNIYKFSQYFSETYYVPFLSAYSKALGNNEYYEQVLRVITMLDDPVISAKKLSGQDWYEIDDIQDLDIASSLFAVSDDEKISLMQRRYGGYWRFPKLIDFCYLVNPYFPPQRMMDEIKANFEKLLTQYPSGMEINSLLAAKNFNIHQEHILVGNGAAELIKLLMSMISGKIGIICPTFEEYLNRYPREDVIFYSVNDSISYTAEDVIGFYEDKDICNLVVINPDNPSGNYIPHNDLKRLVEWGNRKNINLIIDESFIDFSEEEGATLIREDLLEANQNLVVLKSISKSYGVPGLRLGILASGNLRLIEKLKREAAIWNINSFAEFFMQIAEKYARDYTAGLEKFKSERKRFMAELSSIKGIRVYPSQANYVMLELCNHMTSKSLTRNLMVNHNVLIKDLSGKMKIENRQFVRVAVRDSWDNDIILAALKDEIVKKDTK